MRFKMLGRYRIYENGQVYSEISDKFLKPDTDRNGYEQVTLSLDKRPVREKVHRLVAKMFIPLTDEDIDKKRTAVNHIDGNKNNNHYINLEWCNCYENNKQARIYGQNNVSKSNSDRWKDPAFRARTSANFSRTRIETGMSKGRNNGRFRYSVIDRTGTELSRSEVANVLGLCQSATDAYIRKAANETIRLFESHGLKVYDTKKSLSTIERNGLPLTE